MIFAVWAMAVVLFGFSHPPAFCAEELSLQAQVDKTEVSTGQTLLFSITIGGTLEETPRVHLNNFKGFQVVATGQSQQIQIEAGKMRQALNLTYTLVPTQPGTHTLGPFPVEYQGKSYQTQPVEVKVVEGSKPKSKAQPKQKTPRRKAPQLEGGVVL